MPRRLPAPRAASPPPRPRADRRGAQPWPQEPTAADVFWSVVRTSPAARVINWAGAAVLLCAIALWDSRVALRVFLGVFALTVVPWLLKCVIVSSTSTPQERRARHLLHRASDQLELLGDAAGALENARAAAAAAAGLPGPAGADLRAMTAMLVCTTHLALGRPRGEIAACLDAMEEAAREVPALEASEIRGVIAEVASKHGLDLGARLPRPRRAGRIPEMLGRELAGALATAEAGVTGGAAVAELEGAQRDAHAALVASALMVRFNQHASAELSLRKADDAAKLLPEPRRSEARRAIEGFRAAVAADARRS